jgi:hypothetical protein
MSEPDFDLTPEDHVFNVGDQIYVIDDNKVDLLEARIKKRYTRGYLVRFVNDEEEDTKFKDNRRLLLRNEINNGIFEAQQSVRKRQRPSPEPEPEEEEAELVIPSPAGRPPRPKRIPPLKPETIVEGAIAAGVTDSQGFLAYITEKTEAAIALFETRRADLAIDEKPLFKLGGGIEPEDVTAFWKQAKTHWSDLFGGATAVPSEQFVRKIAAAFAGDFEPAAARSLLRKTFQPEPGEEVTIAEYAGFLAEFGPVTTLLRKVNSYWQCSEEARSALQPLDFASIGDRGSTADEEGNSFEIETTGGKVKIVYNLVTVESDGNYLVDDDGRRYGSWVEFCEANPPAPGQGEEEEGDDDE